MVRSLGEENSESSNIEYIDSWINEKSSIAIQNLMQNYIGRSK